MHPAASVIGFTTASGAGYGLIVWLAALTLLGMAPEGWTLAALTLALGLVTGGLLASTFHLGHPERAWRALSQWRTSWLSREGVAALATYAPLGLWWLALALGREAPIAAAVAGFGALATVYTTSMIYASLRAVPAWASGWTPAAYLSLALWTGGLLALLALALSGGSTGAGAVLLAGGAGAVAKAGYWRRAARPGPSTPGTATGLPGSVRLLEPPHTGTNYLMNEMGYVIARRHARVLRSAVWGGLFALPALCVSAAAGGLLPVPLLLLAVASAALGILTERWLFFAEA
ncbi:MAG: DmsC/YnfH family molybdoenzyme membrane anchor subunit, partial [Pseudomonadota bacterium]